ncbi:hypothetical protein KUH03_21425 [Sphingobacterium sp. E70]|uniref:hypothetical protein n=1 Tax=Sphingobacterium sp. E70 TaxID=2853439 RepID=UPI00211BA5F8|nr:hypothetical protein [Sphingobacterium sp. E70]ULT22089.1 hypothetical protein KUH03_21425 [Sphingobacterium sp. E70]
MDINPDDIETYTVLKGPEATAQFGSQGAGGAILITTKKEKLASLLRIIPSRDVLKALINFLKDSMCMRRG